MNGDVAIYIHIGNGSAMIVPRRAFQSDGDFTNFGRLANERLATSGQTNH